MGPPQMNDAEQPKKVEPENAERIRVLKEKIADVRRRWPPHSTPPGLMQQLDDLEEELALEMKRARNS